MVRAFGPAAPTAHPWADIQALDWATAPVAAGAAGAGTGERNASNALRIEDFCRYKYVVHTEGVTYSGRFQFHNLCASVVLTPPVAWLQHLTHLLRPVFSYTLDAGDADERPVASPRSVLSSSSSTSTSTSTSSPRRLISLLRSAFSSLFAPFSSAGAPRQDREKNHEKVTKEKERGQSKSPGLPRHPIDLGPREPPPPLRPYPAPWVRSAWPTSHAASAANIVFVAPDWSDLSATVAWLEAHPRAAAGIARRQRALFADAGYFSPAAEMCYWRGLIRGWSEVARVDEGDFEGLEGVTWEEFSIKEIHK